MLLRTPLHPHRCASRCLAPAWWNHRHAWWPWGSWFAKHQLWVTWQLGRYRVFQMLPYTALYYWLVQASYSMIFEMFVSTRECCIVGCMICYFANLFVFSMSMSGLKEYMWSRWKGPVMFSYISWNDGMDICLFDSLVCFVIPKAKLLVSKWCPLSNFTWCSQAFLEL